MKSFTSFSSTTIIDAAVQDPQRTETITFYLIARGGVTSQSGLAPELSLSCLSPVLAGSQRELLCSASSPSATFLEVPWNISGYVSQVLPGSHAHS